MSLTSTAQGVAPEDLAHCAPTTRKDVAEMIAAALVQQHVKSAGALFSAVAVTLGGLFGILALHRDNTGDVIRAEIRPILVRLDSLEKRQDAADQRFDRIEAKLDKQSEQFDAKLEKQGQQIDAKLAKLGAHIEHKLDKQSEQIAALTTVVARLAGTRESRR
ncbi:hypothetical protein [Paracidovorax citrulli]